MCRTDKRVVLATYLGIIPFYLFPAVELLQLQFILNKFEDLNGFSHFYGSIIVGFLSGMQWQQMIYQKRKNLLFIPFIPLFMVLTYYQNFFYPCEHKCTQRVINHRFIIYRH